MGLWDGMVRRGITGEVKKEDLIDITIKIKSHEIVYGKVKTNFSFNYPAEKRIRDNWWIIADKQLSGEEIAKFCADNGVDIHNMTIEKWKDNTFWNILGEPIKKTFEQAKESYDGTIVETHTYKKTDENCYLIRFVLHWGRGAYRWFNLPIKLDIKEYRKEVGYPITIGQYIDGEMETLLDPEYWDEDYRFKWKMTKEEWNDDENFSQIDDYVTDQRKLLEYEGYSF